MFLLLHQLDVVQLETPVQKGRLRAVEMGEQEEVPFRVGGTPGAQFALGRFRTKVEGHRTFRVLLHLLHVGVDAARFQVAKIRSGLQVVGRNDTVWLQLHNTKYKLGWF